MCSKFPEASKAQLAQGLPKGWKYYFVSDKASRDPSPTLCHPDLIGLRILSKSGKTFYSFEKAISASRQNLSADQKEELVCNFYETRLGVPARREMQHDLVGKGFYREWLDVQGRHCRVIGKIAACFKHLFANDLRFKVEYSHKSRLFFESVTKGEERKLPSYDDDIQESIAWGGYASFLKHIGQFKPVKAFHYNWILASRVPSVGSTDRSPRCEMMVRGFKLMFSVEKSRIPGAGKGLFVKCEPMSELLEAAEFFELEAGCLLDLGIYAPLQAEDRKPEIVSLVKNFVHSWKAESWSFDLACHDKGKHTLFDITDDWTGDLHEKAKENFLVYVNETDGKEVPSILADHDPVSTEKAVATTSVNDLV
jgi:hypothetical protein